MAYKTESQPEELLYCAIKLLRLLPWCRYVKQSAGENNVIELACSVFVEGGDALKNGLCWNQ